MEQDPIGAAVLPTIVVSECLGFAAVRYNGRMLSSGIVSRLRNHVRLVPVCPEVGIGLGVPRDPIRIVAMPGGDRLVQPSTGRDLTDEMAGWAAALLESIDAVDGFILKSRSPSCGTGDVKRYPAGSEDALARRGHGMFARAVLNAHPEVAVDDEASLAGPESRHHFLTRVFATARLRWARRAESGERLGRFHAEHSAVLAVYDRRGEVELRAIARSAAADPGSAADAYGRVMAGLMARPARREAFLEVASELAAKAESRGDAAEASGLRRISGERRRGPDPMEGSTPARRLADWWRREDAEQMADRAVRRFVEPYPRELLDAEDTGTNESDDESS